MGDALYLVQYTRHPGIDLDISLTITGIDDNKLLPEWMLSDFGADGLLWVTPLKQILEEKGIEVNMVEGISHFSKGLRHLSVKNFKPWEKSPREEVDYNINAQRAYKDILNDVIGLSKSM
jgi:hypothetical protein